MSRRLFKSRPRKAALWKKPIDGITVKAVHFLLFGSMVCTIGIHSIHRRTNITEGGIIGPMPLIEHWFEISPAHIISVLGIVCHVSAFRSGGTCFIKRSMTAAMFISGFYKIRE